MSLYDQLAPYYEEIFPFREQTYLFLHEHMPLPGKQVLDIGCGNGHYCAHFADHGFQATGIDMNSNMIDQAILRFPQARFLKLNMLNLASLDATFDLAYCTGNTLSHISGPDLTRFLSDLYVKLNSSAIWIFQVVNWNYFLNLRTDEYQFPHIEAGDGWLRFERRYTAITDHETLFETQLRFGSGNTFQEETHLYPQRHKDYLRYHRDAGFKPVGWFGGFDGKAYHPDRNSALIGVFKK